MKSRKGDFYNKHGTFITDNKSKPLKILTTEELREKLGIDEMKKRLESKPPIIYNDNIKEFQEIERKKKELINGQKNLLKGIYPDTISTVYKESFKLRKNNLNTWENKPDFYTSGVKGKIPDPYEEKRSLGIRTINSALKGKVKNLLFNHYY